MNDNEHKFTTNVKWTVNNMLNSWFKFIPYSDIYHQSSVIIHVQMWTLWTHEPYTCTCCACLIKTYSFENNFSSEIKGGTHMYI